MRVVKKVINMFVLFVMVAGVPIGLYIIKNEVNLGTQATGQSAKLVINTKGAAPTINHWKNLSQGGEERTGVSMFSSVITPLRALEMDYIRIDHIYDFYDVVSKGPDGKLVFSWNKLDGVVEDIQATGATPFFSLSYMPTFLAENNTDEANNWGEWTEIVKATIERYSGRSGKNIPNVYYEVWNEPDLFGNFKMGGAKNYLTMYRASSLGAQATQNTQPFKFGGPATTALYKNWVDGLIRFVQDNNLRLDFYSWHRYSERVDEFERDAINARTWVSAFPDYSALELVISEAGIHSANNPDYDKPRSAIHALASLAATDTDVTRFMSFEAKDGPGPTQYWGRWGILTHEKYGNPIKKDRYTAFEFLNSLGDERLSVSGEGSWVRAIARKSGDAFQVMVVNYDDANRHIEAVPITFENLTGRSFILRRRDFLGRVLDVPITTDTSSYSTIQYFPVNTAAIIELIPR